MNKRELKKLADELWQKYASPDRHGYKDLMREDSFANAVAEALERAERAPHISHHFEKGSK